MNKITKATWNGARADLGARFAIRVGS